MGIKGLLLLNDCCFGQPEAERVKEAREEGGGKVYLFLGMCPFWSDSILEFSEIKRG